MLKKIVSIFLLLLIGIVFLEQSQNKKQVIDKVVLRIGTTATQDTFSINSQNGAFGRMNYNAFVQPYFLDLDEKFILQPDFMRSWEVKDNREIIFTYPTDAKWHDGVPVTGEDLLFTFSFMKKIHTTSSQYIKSVELLDNNRLRIVLTKPMAYAFLRDCAPALQVYPKHIWEKVDNPTKYEGKDAVIGCGPYRFVSYDETAHVSYYEAVSDYFRGTITIPKVEVHSFATQESMLAALKVGQIDAVYDYSLPIRSTLIDWLHGVKNINLGESYNTGNYLLTYGFNSPNTSKLILRQAITNALDYQLMAQTIGGNYGEIANVGIISPGNTGFDSSLPRLSQNIQLSQAELTQAGYKDIDGDGYREDPDGKKLDLLITPNCNAKKEVNLRLAEIIHKNLQDVGLRSHIDYIAARNKQVWQERILEKQDYEIYVGYNTTIVARFGTAAFYMVSPKFGYHWGTCPDEKYAAIFSSMLQAKDEVDYSKAVKNLQDIHAKLLPGVSLGWEKAFFPYRTDRFTGWINYPSWGVINNKTWFQVKLKE